MFQINVILISYYPELFGQHLKPTNEIACYYGWHFDEDYLHWMVYINLLIRGICIHWILKASLPILKLNFTHIFMIDILSIFREISIGDPF